MIDIGCERRRKLILYIHDIPGRYMELIWLDGTVHWYRTSFWHDAEAGMMETVDRRRWLRRCDQHCHVHNIPARETLQFMERCPYERLWTRGMNEQIIERVTIEAEAKSKSNF
jgi:hypothetical protein